MLDHSFGEPDPDTGIVATHFIVQISLLQHYLAVANLGSLKTHLADNFVVNTISMRAHLVFSVRNSLADSIGGGLTYAHARTRIERSSLRASGRYVVALQEPRSKKATPT